jgi:hypothetical protein
LKIGGDLRGFFQVESGIENDFQLENSSPPDGSTSKSCDGSGSHL